MISINSSYINLVNQHSLARNTKELQKAMERLSTGVRINHAADDPAGLYIATSLSSQISSLKVANENTLLASSFLNIADGALSTVSNCLMRMNDLATQACNSTMSAAARNALQSELNAMVDQINQSIAGAKMNGVATLTTGAGAAPAAPVAVPAVPAAPVQPAAANSIQKTQDELVAEGYVACTAENLAAGGNTKFYISSAAHLQALATATNSGISSDGRTFTLAEDIDLSSVCSEASGNSWTPIGYFNEYDYDHDWDKVFSGTFDGNCHVIKNLYVNNSDSQYDGLFGFTDHATIKNLGLEDVNVSGSEDTLSTGGLVGYAQCTSITDCYVTGNVSGDPDVGGIVGTLYDASITNSYSTATVSGNRRVGGLVGNSWWEAHISNSYSTGNVTGTSNVGGISGYVGEDCSTINSYATGNVNGTPAAEAANKAGFDDSMLDDDMWDKTGSDPELNFGTYVTFVEAVEQEPVLPAPFSESDEVESQSSNSVIRLQVGDTTDANSAVNYNSAISLNLEGLDLSTIDGARAAMAQIQAQMETVTAKQSYIGVQQNRLSSIYDSQQIKIENLSAARSTIMDTDYAKETANMIKYQILQQISASILTQTQKMSGQIALSLLK